MRMLNDAITGTEVLNINSTGDATFAGQIKSTQAAGSHNATPTLAFGDGDSGFYERFDDDIRVSIAGTGTWEFAANSFGGVNGGNAIFNSETATTTNPTVLPYRNDPDTGIGGDGSNTLSLIAGGTQALSLTTTTATFAGTVSGTSATFNGGVTIDGIFIDGTKIDLSSGSLEIEAASNIVLDSHAHEIHLQASGTAFGKFYVSSGDFYINQPVADEDIKFSGTDGVVSVNALTLDMSDGGSAHFNNGIFMPNYLYHTSDTDTYIGYPSTGKFVVITNNGERLDINDSGVELGSGGARVTTILDEDNMGSNSATALATQQSIKAYVDTSTTGVLTYQGSMERKYKLSNIS